MLFLIETTEIRGNTVINIGGAAIGFLAKLITNLHHAAILSAFGVSSVTLLDLITSLMSEINKSGNDKSLLPNQNQLPVRQLSKCYRELVKTVQAVNNMWSRLCLCCILYQSCWMSTRLDVILRTTDVIVRVVVDVIERLVFVSVLVLNAECCRRVRLGSM